MAFAFARLSAHQPQGQTGVSRPVASMSAERDILQRYRTIAVVGASSDTVKPAGYVPAYMQEHGYQIIPVNPSESEVLGEPSYPDLASVPRPFEIVNIFRHAEDVPPVVEAAIAAGAKVVWMQLGIINEEAATVARAAGLEVIMDRCMKTELRWMIEDGEWREC